MRASGNGVNTNAVDSVEGCSAERGKRFELEVEPPKDRPRVAMVIPFHAGDKRFVTECLEACKAQEHVEVEIHAIADGCDWPRTPRGVIRHETLGAGGRIGLRITCFDLWTRISLRFRTRTTSLINGDFGDRCNCCR